MPEYELDLEHFRGTNQRSMLAGRAELWIVGNLSHNPDFFDSILNLIPSGYRIWQDWSLGGFSVRSYIWTSSKHENDSAL